MLEQLRCEAAAAQDRVVAHDEPAFVSACPGAGKTRTMVRRVARLVPSLPTRRGIAVLSFTNSAVDEFRERAATEGILDGLGFPSFVGTLDGFINHFLIQPFGIPGVDARPTVVESWDHVTVGRVPLSAFDAATGRLDIDAVDRRLRKHAKENIADLEPTALRRRASLIRKGYLCADDARVIAAQRLEDPAFARRLGEVLRARFVEVIVDEAQDCNVEDVRVLRWLHEAGPRLMVVCDPDQAIYGFRRMSSADGGEALEDFAGGLSKLSLRGNYRSAPAICRFAATLRKTGETDTPVGDSAACASAVLLLPYSGRSVCREIGESYERCLAQAGIAPDSAIVLAHSRRQAARATGLELQDMGSSRAARLAQAVANFHAGDASGLARRRAVHVVTALLLDLEGKLELDEPTSAAIVRLQTDERELRRKALTVLTAMPATVESGGGAGWVACARVQLQQVLGLHGSIASLFPTPTSSHIAKLEVLLTPAVDSLRYATVHEAKGREYESVCVVLPPGDRTAELVERWENTCPGEAERVVYVAATRPRRLLIVALPESVIARVQRILAKSGVPFELLPTVGAATRPTGREAAGQMSLFE